MNSTISSIPEFKQPDAENLFLASGNGLKSYGDLAAFQRFFLQFIIDYDHDFDKPVGFLADSSDKLIFAIGACWLLGIPFVCYHPQASGKELQRQFDQLETGLVFTDGVHEELVPADQRISFSQFDLDKAIAMDVELSITAKNFTARVTPDHIFGYFFTSGTTAKPKIVPLKRRQMLVAAQSSAENFRPRANHLWLLCLPLSHIGGISIILRSILYGSGIYRMNRFDVQTVSTFLSENPMFQAASLVPTMLKRLLEIPQFRPNKNFQAILLGGGPCDPDLLKECTKKGIPLVSSYGMTETCAQIAANFNLKPNPVYIPMKSVGTVFSGNEIQIRDRSNEEAGVNNSGTIWLKGPQVFDGYLDKRNNIGVFDETGWFNTGDFGHLNANGHLFVETRRSDLIITGGENVSPFEIESELEKIDPIIEAAVFGVQDKEWGQRVVAVVVSKTEQKIETDKILETLKGRVTSFKIPKQIIQTDNLPRTRSGKILRNELVRLLPKA